jgi:hypothetical protein
MLAVVDCVGATVRLQWIMFRGEAEALALALKARCEVGKHSRVFDSSEY